MGYPEGDGNNPLKWRGAFSSRILPHGVLACRAAVLNLLADGLGRGVRSWSAVAAITHTRNARKPISIAYADVHVPSATGPLTADTFADRTVFDLLLKMKDPGRAIAELQGMSHPGILRDPISRLLDMTRRRPEASIDELFSMGHPQRRIV